MLMFLNQHNDLSQAMIGSYQPGLVVLSFIIACIASSTALSVLDRLHSNERSARKFWTCIGAISLGLGIWAMHFIGMLAFVLPITVSYKISTTLLSIIPAIIAGFIVITQLSRKSRSHLQLLGCGLLMGAGIGCMHYMGMAAMQLSATMAYQPLLFGLSLIIAITLATLALYCCYFEHRSSANNKLLTRIASALFMGAAITGMHYTGMWSVHFFPTELIVEHDQGFPQTPFGLLVAVISALLLLLAAISSKAESKLEIARAKITAQSSAEELKNQFISTITHELLTPLNGINLSLSLLQEQQKTDNHYIDMAMQSADHMQELVNTMIIFTEARRNGLKINPSTFNSKDFFDGIINHKKWMLDKPLTLIYHCDDDVPEWLYSDQNKIAAILIQLIRNAIKFTEQGAIDVRCFIDAHSHQLCISVQDQGIGIKEKTHKRLLKEFHQADNSNNRQYSGLGIGLSIVKDILKLMQGKLTVVSAPGKGSTFTVTLPLAIPNEQQFNKALSEKYPHTQQLAAKSAITVLIAEDNPVNMMLLTTILESLNYQTLTACNGQEALSLVDKESIDIILMDCQMPIVDGFAATLAIRKKYSPQQLPIIAITANISDIDQKHCLAAGMNDFLPKPVNKETLQARLRYWLAQRIIPENP